MLCEQRCDIEDIVCVTAQHRRHARPSAGAFEITPDHDLDVMEHGQSLHGVTAKIIQRLQPVLEQSKPDMVLVHGDTATCFAASLAAFIAAFRSVMSKLGFAQTTSPHRSQRKAFDS